MRKGCKADVVVFTLLAEEAAALLRQVLQHIERRHKPG